MDKEKIFLFEKERLENVIDFINKRIAIAENRFSEQEHSIIGFKEGMRGTQFTRQSLMSFYATELNDLKSVLSNPYFGRFEFKDNSDSKLSTIYIGKKTIYGDGDDILAYDWRNPVCSLYYDYNIGDAEYLTNNKTIRGKILSKRQIMIKDGKLLNVEEQDVLSNDQILIKYLSENSDSKLKSIVATIQREQNKIIRSSLNHNYIIQGVAGSGKTTVALHRIAYLLYNESRNVNESEFLVLGPSKYFLDYISSLLPDLDVGNVSHSTFEDLALSNIKNKIKLESKNILLQNVLNNVVNEDVIKFKNSIEYLDLIDNFIKKYFNSFLNKDIVYEGIVLCPSSAMSNIYGSDTYLKKHSYSERTDIFIKSLIKKVKENYDDLSHDIWLKYRDEYLSLEKDDPKRKEINDKINDIRNIIKKGCSSQIKSYFSYIKESPLSLYKKFIEYIGNSDINISIDKDELVSYTIKKLNKKTISSEDLAPILYVSYLVNGIKTYYDYKHLVIDEAQDLSLSQYFVLKKMFPNATFDIYGDVNQSIYDYQSIHNWNVLNDEIFDSEAEILNLNKSYRTTEQISNASNLILDYMNYDVTDCISREGKVVKANHFDKSNEMGLLVDEIHEILSDDYNNIAIICKDDKETDYVYKSLKNIGININKLSEDDVSYNGTLCVLPSYLSKGLEFDAAIIYNASDMTYSDSDIDLKLLYVSMTRAMHQLYINYDGELVKPLKKIIINDNKIEKSKLLSKVKNT